MKKTKIEWNKVTWYSKTLAVIIFVGTFYLGFYLGTQFTQIEFMNTVIDQPIHCGGFIKNAPTCPKNYHCQLKVNNPDTGGICLHD